MHLSTRQARIYKLAILLGSGKPVAAETIITALNCSEPTLTRALKELRESYAAEIKYSKAGHSYQLTGIGQLDKKALRRMNEALTENAEAKPAETVSRVFLDKDKKKAISLSLRMSLLRKINRLSRLNEITRSEAVDMAAARGIDQLIEEALAKKKGN
ncbi:tellurium resistance protein TerW [Erwinia sp. S38]|uniref:tellurium resistance protein TerW n=1 Tax=Erwinia sp. S38 TaxID=2769338 RepID=UPI00190D70EE|nr:tellurium resistance protein TerW [Erwinia sp. S38]MBK0002611.1 tellurium resistance protein TerW [Erwinia sp. S38]